MAHFRFDNVYEKLNSVILNLDYLLRKINFHYSDNKEESYTLYFFESKASVFVEKY